MILKMLFVRIVLARLLVQIHRIYLSSPEAYVHYHLFYITKLFWGITWLTCASMSSPLGAVNTFGTEQLINNE